MKLHKIMLGVLAGLFSCQVSAFYIPDQFESSELQVVYDANYTPLVWSNLDKYDIDFGFELGQVISCGEAACEAEALAEGAYYSRRYDINEFIYVIVFYDQNGNIIGTHGVDSTPPPPPPPPMFYERPEMGELDSQKVGGLDGQLEITPTGSASYSVALDVPPGTAGMQPQVSVNYDSQAGEAELGLSWGLSAFSTITRCPKTPVQDNYLSGNTYKGYGDNPNHSSDDRFCLDGQRLVAVHGSYGADGTEYRTETGSDLRIISYGLTGIRDVVNSQVVYTESGPEKFVVYGKDGSISEYGYTENSRIKVPGKQGVRVWAQNKVSDQYDNYYELKFLESTDYPGTVFLSRIDYTGNSQLNMMPNASVRVSYEGKFQTGATILEDGRSINLYPYRISKIETYLGESLADRYTFYYKSYSGVEVQVGNYLTSIEKCTVDECINSLAFDWQGSQGGTGEPEFLNICRNGSTEFGNCNSPNYYYSFQYPDIDNDGKSDICYLTLEGVRCRVSNRTQPFDVVTDICADASPDLYGGCGYTNYDSIRYIDVNADGKSDLVFRSDSGIQVYSWTGSDFSLMRSTDICANGQYACNDSDNHDYIQYIDLNADGFADVCYRSDLGIKCHFGSEAGWGQGILSNICANGSDTHDGICNSADNYKSISFIDVNGDGNLELAYRSDSGFRIADWVPGHGFVITRSTDVCGNGYPGCDSDDNYSYVYYVNQKGYGQNFICYRSDTGMACLQVTDSGIFSGISTDACANNSLNYGGCDGEDNYKTIKFVDIDGDGKDELTFRSDNEGIKVFANTIYSPLPSSKYPVLSNLCSSSGAGIGVCDGADNFYTIGYADFNGDGDLDLIYRSDDYGLIRFIDNNQSTPLIAKITNGFGIETELFYTPLADRLLTDDYDIGLAYPYRKTVHSKYVVHAKRTENGKGGTGTIRYWYRNPVVHLQGRGDLGFLESMTLNEETNLYTTINYEMAFPFTGMKKSENQRILMEDDPSFWLRDSNLTLSSRLSQTGQLIPYVSREEEKVYDLDNTLISTVVTETSLDQYGNVLTNKVTTSDSSDISELYETYTQNVYRYSPLQHINGLTPEQIKSDWLLNGQLSSSSVYQSGPRGTSPTVRNNYSYLATGSLYTESGSVEGDVDGQFGVFSGISKTYAYDEYGNMVSTLVQAPGLDDRLVTKEYGARGQFPEIVTNEMGHQTITTYDPSLGVPLSVTGANGLPTFNIYNAWGEVIETMAPGGNKTKTVRSWCSINCEIEAINSAYTTHTAKFIETRSVAGGNGGVEKYAPDVVTYYDDFGREIRVSTTGYNGLTVYKDTAYDDLGRVVAVTRPYFAGDPKIVSTTEYDLLNRPVRTLVSGEGETLIERDGLKTVTSRLVFNPVTNNSNTVKQTEYKNVIGQITKIIDNDDNQILFEYDAQGNKTKTRLPKVDVDGDVILGEYTEIEVQYDIFGRKKKMIDPNMGTWIYSYDNLSHLRSQTNALGQMTTMDYDRLGRLVKRTDHDGVETHWQYNDDLVNSDVPLSKGIGKLDTVWMQDSTGFELYRENHTYTTDLGLLNTSEVVIEEGNVSNSQAVSYTTQNVYDRFHRPSQKNYPTTVGGNQLQIKYEYIDGVVDSIQSADGLTTYWAVDGRNASGEVTGAGLANGQINALSDFDDAGRLTYLHYNVGSRIYQADYQYDNLGNLVSRDSVRQDLAPVLNEEFYYDKLNRLTCVKTNQVGCESLEPGAVNGDQQYHYDVLGNIREKNGVGVYQYEADRINAISRLDWVDEQGVSHSNSYSYNANGALISGAGRNVTWTPFNKPASITSASAMSEFRYGPSRGRYYHRSTDLDDASKNRLTYYVGGMLEKIIEDGVIKYRQYIQAGGKSVAQYTVYESAPDVLVEDLEYVLRDNQGSTVAIVDEQGNITANLDYDAFGRRRAVLGESEISTIVHSNPRGYTGHEHLEKLGLIHMNGRVYDPMLGRFLSADPVIQFANNLQSYNRFSYVLNNPMSYTDPSGFRSWRKKLRRAIKAAVAIHMPGTTASVAVMYSKPVKNLFLKYEWARIAGQAAASFYGGAGGAAAFSGYITDISGGSFNDIARSVAVSLAASALYGEAHDMKFDKVNFFTAENGLKILAHGAIGGGMSYANGGDFRSGFIAASASQAFSLAGGYGKLGLTEKPQGFVGYVSNGAAAAIVGGAISRASGGDFESGAMSALYGRLFNDLGQDEVHDGMWAMTEHELEDGTVVMVMKEDLLALRGEVTNNQNCSVYKVSCVVIGIVAGEGPMSNSASTNIDRSKLVAEGIMIKNGVLNTEASKTLMQSIPYFSRAAKIIENSYNFSHFTQYCSAQCSDNQIRRSYAR